MNFTLSHRNGKRGSKINDGMNKINKWKSKSAIRKNNV